MKTCRGCGAEIERTSPKANNKQYCSAECRDAHYKKRNAEKIKARYDHNNHKRYNQYEEGKEQCAICGGWYWAVCHHVAQRHKINEHDYKRMIGVDVSKGRLPNRTKKIKRAHVFENGTVENLKKGAHRRYKKGDRRAGKYERSPETMARLRKQIKRISKAK